MTADHPVRPWVVTDPCTCTKPGRAPDLSPTEAAWVAEFDAAPEPPEIRAIRPLLAKLRAVEAVLDEAEQVMEPGGIALVVTARVRRALDAS